MQLEELIVKQFQFLLDIWACQEVKRSE